MPRRFSFANEQPRAEHSDRYERDDRLEDSDALGHLEDEPQLRERDGDQKNDEDPGHHTSMTARCGSAWADTFRRLVHPFRHQEPTRALGQWIAVDEIPETLGVIRDQQVGELVNDHVVPNPRRVVRYR